MSDKKPPDKKPPDKIGPGKSLVYSLRWLLSLAISAAMSSSEGISTASSVADEETALLSPTSNGKQKQRRTPLPRVQLGIIMICQLAEPIMSQCIYPFINELVGTLDIVGGDETKIGYYAGLIQSLFFATEALTVLQWSRLSDRIGRKPVLLIGLSGLCFSMIFFGLSRTFWSLVLSRCLNGVLNGNTGVMKSMIGEMTDTSNIAQAFALLPLTWALGVSIGPFIGGTLARPHDTWPKLFSNSFWQEYPYFLPCFVSAIFSAFAFFVVLLFLKETVGNEDDAGHKRAQAIETTGIAYEQYEAGQGTAAPPVPAKESSVSLRALCNRTVVLAVGNYALLALQDIAFAALQPLFYSTPIEFGGLGFSPRTIGYIMASLGIGNGIFQIFFFPPIVNRLGKKRVFMLGMASFIPIFALPPVINQMARAHGISPAVWVALVIQLMLCVLMELAYGTIFIYVTHSAPSRRTLGAVNGLAQTIASIVRAIGPAMSTSLFALSTSRNLLGGYAVYLIMIIIAALSLPFAAQLSDQEDEEDE